MNAWPVVCMTAWASSNDRALIRARISAHTAARASRSGVAPGRHPGLRRREQRVDVGHVRVGDAEVDAVRAALAADGVGRARGVELERLPEHRLERASPASGMASPPYAFGCSGIGRPVGPLADRLHRAVEQLAVPLDELGAALGAVSVWVIDDGSSVADPGRGRYVSVAMRG